MSRIYVSVVALMLFATACATDVPAPPTAPTNLLDARGAALEYVQSRYLAGPDLMLLWQEERVADESLGDWVEYQYTAVPWIATIGGPTAGQAADSFDVVVTNPVAGFTWQGRVGLDGHGAEGSEPVLAACDITCDYIADRFPELHLDDLVWAGRRVTPAGPVGHETYEYTADDWSLTVSYPVVAPDEVTFHASVENAATGFVWEGEMDLDGDLTETAAHSRVPEAASK